jgi:hypothetical protein
MHFLQFGQVVVKRDLDAEFLQVRERPTRSSDPAKELEIAIPSAKTRQVSHLQTSTPGARPRRPGPWQYPS